MRRDVHAFADPCELGNAGSAPHVQDRKRISVGAFRCQVVRSGVTCTDVATGKGFYMTAHHVASVGGASIVPAPLHIREFLSPDRSVWYVLEDRGCGTQPEPPTRSAEIDSHGDVSFCDFPELIVPPGGHEPEGCFQNLTAVPQCFATGRVTSMTACYVRLPPDGITCTLAGGAGKEKGFRINGSEAVEIPGLR
jgi:hypothetical protein